MDAVKIREVIVATFMDVLKNTDRELKGELKDDTVLLDSGMDSLGFAILVARLEEELGWDPFTLSDSPYYPEKFGGFVSFYADNQP